ncbi:MAG TPA: hypothetical protein VE990_17470 [Acidimicrobiales bacterium]|nr:hypothetical protein [Acidimicrobiales bacterium]
MAERTRRPSSVVAALLALGVVAGGCAHAAGPGVAVQRVESDISFGLPNSGKPQAAVPPSLATPNLTGPTQSLPAFVYTTTTTFNYGSPSYGGTSEAPTCPQPPYGASPDKAASITVQGKPKPGVYKWQIVTSQPVAGTNQTLTDHAYVTYKIEHVSATTQAPNPAGGTTDTFTYDVVSPGPQGGTITTTYEVKENAVQVSGTAGNFGQAQHAGAPDRGISLVSVVDRNGGGTVTATFNPSPPVLLFPLDVQSPQSFQAVGVDPATGASFSNSATVSGATKRVNACGQLVDGWDVTGTQTFSGSGGSSGTTTGSVDYAVATQYGGILIYQATTPTGSNKTETDIIGQLDPDPLPPS